MVSAKNTLDAINSIYRANAPVYRIRPPWDGKKSVGDKDNRILFVQSVADKVYAQRSGNWERIRKR